MFATHSGSLNANIEIKRMKSSLVKIVTSVFCLFLPLLCLSQDTDPDGSVKDSLEKRAAFIGLTAGLGNSSFRDFATSPLIYEGPSLYLALNRMKMSDSKESEFGISTSAGFLNIDFNEHFTSSGMFTGSIFYSQLYELAFMNSPKWNLKAGGLIDVTGSLRLNDSFGNNSLGFELFPALFGSVKITRDISRTTAKQKKILFVNYRSNPINRSLSLRINPGLINSTFRNKFIYLRHSSAIEGGNPFADYEYKLFSGLRLSTAVDYTVRLKNRNWYQVSYLWNVYRTGGNLDKFEMAQHMIKLTLYYNTNNK